MLFSNVTCHDVQVGGIAFDAFGNFWATMIFADRLVAVTPEGDVLELLNDVDLAATARFEAAFAAGGTVDFEIMLACGGPICTWMPSITFGGADLSTVYLGGLRSTSIPSFRSPVAGLPMVHWLPTAPPPRSRLGFDLGRSCILGLQDRACGFRLHSLGTDRIEHLSRRHRPTEIVSLRISTTQRLENSNLVGIFHSLR